MHLLLLLGGDPPGRALLKEQIDLAGQVLAVDGGINIDSLDPDSIDLILGDLDSAHPKLIKDVPYLKLPDQNLTDLQKTLGYVNENLKPTHITILGGSGRRSDHTVNNLQICASFPADCQITFLNDVFDQGRTFQENIFRITPQTMADFLVGKGTTLSVFSVSPFTGLTSQGLTWEIVDADSNVGFFSQSNQASVDNISLTLDSGCVYLAVYQ